MTQTFEMKTTERVLGVLGPTNTGKTHYAIERMMAHRTGMIGLPLRLLAREIYDRIVAIKGADVVALVTGEEKIVPKAAAYWVCTTESMPLGMGTEFMAIDEIQMCADPERGHIFTDRLLNARGTHETLFLGAETMRGLIQRLVPHAQFITRPRFSDLAYTGAKKLTRLPRRSAIVAFTANQVYEIAELIRRQRGGAAVVMGSLSPRTRNAQVALYQSGEVDFIVATDAIGMGLNMDIDHVAFASLEKFDGETTRPLRPQELAQIAGRAGRHMNDGTFGVTGEAPEMDAGLVEQIEGHRFDPVRVAQWRNSDLDYGSIDRLMTSLDALPAAKGLQRVRPSTDLIALRILKEVPEVAEKATTAETVRRLWDVCQVPDFRKITIDEHARLLVKLFDHMTTGDGTIPDDWIGPQIEGLDVTEGEIDAIQARLSHIRTWAYVANRPGWLADGVKWQEKARAVEDKLSDALHEKLTERFIDRRTSVLMKRLREDDEFAATVGEDGEVLVDGEYVGRLEGVRFAPDPRALGLHGRALKAAAFRGLQGELARRAFAIANAEDKAFSLTDHGRVWWDGAIIAMLEPGHAALKPRVTLMADEQITPTAWARAESRVREWVESRISHVLQPLLELQSAVDAEGDKALPAQARGFAFRLSETMGALDRELVRNEVERLPPADRAALRKLGVKFARFSVFMPALIKPEAARLMGLLAAVKAGLASVPRLPSAGLTSTTVNPDTPVPVYAASGYRVLGPRAVRLDMLERLGDAIEAKRDAEKKLPPFAISPDMLSLLGCAADEMAGVLTALNFKSEGAKTETGADLLLWRPRRRAELERPQPNRRPGGGAPGQDRPRGPNRRHAGPPRAASVEAAPMVLGEDGLPAAPAEAKTGETRPGGDQERRRRRRGGKPHHREGQAPTGEANVERPTGEAAPRPDRPRHERPQHDRPKHDRPRRDGDRPHGGGPRPPRDDAQPNRDQRPPRPPERRERPEKPLDPNSPFAILSKLKG
jgi:ATP-dependent RNA helicase SUPV3L1/SUV3